MGWCPHRSASYRAPQQEHRRPAHGKPVFKRESPSPAVLRVRTILLLTTDLFHSIRHPATPPRAPPSQPKIKKLPPLSRGKPTFSPRDAPTWSQTRTAASNR